MRRNDDGMACRGDLEGRIAWPRAYAALLQTLAPQAVLEVAVDDGDAPAHAWRAGTEIVAVDPGYTPPHPCPAHVRIFPEPFAAVFADKADGVMGVGHPGVCLVGGDRSAQETLDAVLGCACRMAPGGTIAVAGGMPGNGSAWKALFALKAYLPEIEMMLLDAAPAGLSLVRGLDPEAADGALRAEMSAFMAGLAEVDGLRASDSAFVVRALA